MSLKTLRITNLFKKYDYVLEFNIETGITVIVGPNGLGKTRILYLIQAFLEFNLDQFQSILFSRLIFEFTNGISITIEKENLETISGITIRNGEREQVFDIRSGDLKAMKQVYNESIPDSVKYPVKLIDTKRLYQLGYVSEANIEYTNFNIIDIIIKKYSDDTVELINQTKSKTTVLSRKFEETFNDRLGNLDQIELSDDDLRSELNKVYDKLDDLDKKGMLGRQVKRPELSDELNNDSRKLIQLIINDYKEIIKTIEEFYLKLELFTGIVNQTLIDKHLEIDGHSGMKIILNDGSNLPLAQLSSGEQHQVIIWFEILLKSSGVQLFLIDEPEISLHVTWQTEFIPNLIKVQKLLKCRFIIATHSPDIIDKFWDYTVELDKR